MKKIHRRDAIFFGLILIMLIYLIPTYRDTIAPGLDPSWKYGINWAFDRGLRWGKDIIFTYGPLGMLTFPQNIGSNLTYSYIFWTCCFTLNAVAFIFFFKDCRQVISTKQVMVSTALFLLATFTFTAPEYYLIYMAILYVSLFWWEQHEKRNTAFWIIVNSIFLISFFIKLSAAIIVGSLIFFTLIAKKFCKKPIKKYIFIFIGYVMLLGIILYVYTKSTTNLINYMIGNMAISSGYNIAMGIEGYKGFVFFGLAIIALYYAITIVFGRYHKETFFYLLSFSGLIFFIFKHGFVRADGHMFYFFFCMLLLVSVQLLFINLECIDKMTLKLKKTIYSLTIAGISTYVMLFLCFNMFAGINLLSYNQIENKYNALQATYGWKNEKNYILATEENVLPEDIIKRIGKSKVTIWPWELSYNAYNNLNFVPLPVFQAYFAYTPFLDHVNAEFLESPNAPEFIIFEFAGIDGMHPLLEIPATWAAINDNYVIEIIEDNIGLLKKVNKKYEKQDLNVSQINIGKNEVIGIPKNDNLLVATIDMKLSVLGKLVSFFYKIPETDINILDSGGKQHTYRIVPENLKNGVIVNKIPFDLIGSAELLNKAGGNSSVEKFRFSGPGLKYYKNDIKIVFEELTPMDSKNVGWSYTNNDLSPRVENIRDVTEKHGVGNIDKLGTLEIGDGLLELQGWIKIDDMTAENQEVYIEVTSGDQVYTFLAKSTLRKDVADYLGSKDYNRSGFESILPLPESTEENKLYGRIIVRHGQEYLYPNIKFEIDRTAKEIRDLGYTIDKKVLSNIDEISYQDMSNKILITGWAYIKGYDSKLQKVYVEITDQWENKKYYQATSQERPDVAEYFSDSKYTFSGMQVLIPNCYINSEKIQIRLIVKNNGILYGSEATTAYEIKK